MGQTEREALCKVGEEQEQNRTHRRKLEPLIADQNQYRFVTFNLVGVGVLQKSGP